MEIRTYPFGPLQANLYVAVFGNDAVIIDPCVPFESLDLDGITVRGIICTHAHYDHIVEAESIRSITGSTLLAYEDECAAILAPKKDELSAYFPPLAISAPICGLEDGDVLTARDFSPDSKTDLTIRVLHTPGHTSGSMCLLFEERTSEGISKYLFSGDTIFAGSIGRTDLGGSMPDMLDSLARLAKLPDDVIVFPGHGQSTSMGIEKRSNPYFTALNYDDII